MADSRPSTPTTHNGALWLTVMDEISCHVPGMGVIPGTLARISEQGAWLRAGMDLEVAAFLTVEWRTRADVALRLPSRVVQRKQEEDAIFGFYGVRFHNLEERDKDILAKEIVEVDRRTRVRPREDSSIAQKVASQLNTKRAAFRANVEFDIQYMKAGQNARRIGKASSLSTGGLRLETIEQFEEGTVLHLHVALPDEVLKRAKLAPGGDKTIHGVSVRPFERLMLKSRLVKAFKDKNNPRWQYGVAFLDPSAHDVEELRRFIHLSQLHELTERVH